MDNKMSSKISNN